MIEVEAPWMESTSNYPLAENMTFQVDTFVSAEAFGIRWETGVVIRKDRAELLSQPIGKIFEIGTPSLLASSKFPKIRVISSMCSSESSFRLLPSDFRIFCQKAEASISCSLPRRCAGASPRIP